VRGRAEARARKALWRVVLGVTGGLRVSGVAALPAGPCVIVANHNSHADTAALIAALPARRRPVVAAAADYWFGGGCRAWSSRMLCAAFPVRRAGGGGADLAAAARMLAAGHDVIVYPEGTRSRDGRIGDFHRGAVRLAALAGVPLVPAGITGTRTLLPPGGPARRARVTVRFGAPIQIPAPVLIPALVPMPSLALSPTGKTMIMNSFGRHLSLTAHDHEPGPRGGVEGATEQARVRVVALAGGASEVTGIRDSRWRVGVAGFAGSWWALAVVAGWAFGEALCWPLLPELILAVLCVAAPKAGVRLAGAAALGSVAGGAVGYLLAARGVVLPEPLTTVRMHAAVAAQVAAHGAAAVHAQPLSGIPFKVYVAAAGAHRAGLGGFLAASAQARGARILAAGLVMTVAGACAGRLRRFYPAYLAGLAAVFTGGLWAVVAAWS
jgi:1-acyl-sn-glycerol-3-phosphate acyltransferase